MERYSVITVEKQKGDCASAGVPVRLGQVFLLRLY